MSKLRALVVLSLSVVSLVVPSPAQATPVCTDGYQGGPPLAVCGGRVFPESALTRDYVQYSPNRLGFREYQHGIEYLESLYPRWMEVFTLRSHFGDDDAVSAGPDARRAYDPSDTGDGHDIFVIKLTDEQVPDAGKETLLYSLSIHGDEKGGIEGGVRAAEDLVMAAEEGGTITDGVSGYESTTGSQPEFHSYPVAEVLANQVVYLVNFNIDGWRRGDHASAPSLYNRRNQMGTDLNRQMPTVGWINPSRNPLTETEMLYGHRFMEEVAAAGIGGQMAYGADVHGEGVSRAWADIMYPAGQFDSVKHRRLMSIAERTKSLIDDSLFLGAANAIEEQTGGDGGEGIEDSGGPKNTVPTKPARWGTVWDTLGYTDTGFLGDYMATELGVTGMDYEIALNHADSGREYGRPWAVLLQENYINTTRAIIKGAMAYAMTERQDFNEFSIDPVGRVGYVFDPNTVSDTDENGSGTLPGPKEDGIGQNGLPVTQAPYDATNMQFFEDENGYVEGGLNKALTGDIASDPAYLDQFDSLVIADVLVPQDANGRSVDESAYFANLKAWVERGGNLVLTDRAVHALERMQVLPDGSVSDITVYQPYSNFEDLGHPMVQGLRGNARQLSEATLIGYKIPASQTASVAFSPMSIVTRAAWEAAGGDVVGTTGNTPGTSDNGNQVSVGEIAVGNGQIRIMGGGLAKPTEAYDHRYGLKDYSLTYSGLFILENSIVHDDPDLGRIPPATRPTVLSLSAPGEGQYSDAVDLNATLTTEDGAPIADALVTFDLTGESSNDSWTGTTGSDGTVSVPARLLLEPGDYLLVARYAGQPGEFDPSAAPQSFVIAEEDTSLSLTKTGKGSSARLEARLTDADDPSAGIEGAPIAFSSNGETLGAAFTDGTGVAVFDLPSRYGNGRRSYGASFDGAPDPYYKGATAAFSS